MKRPRRIPDAHLRRLRNELPIHGVIERIVELPNKEVEGVFRFLCPRCNEFHTAIHPRENLARCFRSQQNFNAIDLVVTEERCSFVDAVRILQRCLRGTPPSN